MSGASLRFRSKPVSYTHLLELAGDIGGKRVINKHLDETFFYDVEEEQELEDIDENNLQSATINGS